MVHNLRMKVIYRNLKTISDDMAIIIYLVLLFQSHVEAEFYEDRRCSCVCLNPDKSGNHVRIVYQENQISPEQCNCKDMVLPKVMLQMNASWLTYCIQCECHYETRNTKMVMVVVMLLCTIISVLMVYMMCLKILEKIVTKPKTNSLHHGDDQELHVLLNDTCPETDAED